ncbi:DUF4430 domain-containing protein [Ornithinibacillus salinisoli]|uniref:DUF4430 domain-containing protein n=1 Tax=Ornithinibacillus salinisoli TaxID=1848459 RepID=A0ABW4W4D5_9BACI
MSKWVLRIATLLFVLGFVAGCGNENPSGDNGDANVADGEESVEILISKDEGAEVITKEEISIEEGDILMEVMKEHFDVEEDGGFITSIEGISPEEGEQKAWMYFINGESASVGANEYELTPGEEINFDLQAW